MPGTEDAKAVSAMTRIPQRLPAELEWINVSVWRRCPICGGAAGCKTHADGDFAACGKQPSDWPLTSGAWLHRVRPAFARKSTPVEPVDAPPANDAAPSVVGTAS
jgi:hypothetical protein